MTVIEGGAGADAFAFGAEDSDGRRDRDLIRDADIGAVSPFVFTDDAFLA